MYSRIKHQGYGIKSFLSELGSQLTDKACQLIESQLESEVDVWLYRQPCQRRSQVSRQSQARDQQTPPYPSARVKPARPSTIVTVSMLTVMTRPTRSTMYCWSSLQALGSLTMPLRLSVLTRYWSTTHSSAERVPRR